MKRRRWVVKVGVLAVVVAVVILLMVLQPFRQAPDAGEWTSTGTYAGTGTIGFTFHADGRVEVTTANPNAAIWWASNKYELWLRKNVIEIRNGEQTVGELRIKHVRDELRLLDTAYPAEVLCLRKKGPA